MESRGHEAEGVSTMCAEATFAEVVHRSDGTYGPADLPRGAGGSDRILDAMRSWTGPRNKKGKPKVGALSEALGFTVTRERRNALWEALR